MERLVPDGPVGDHCLVEDWMWLFHHWRFVDPSVDEGFSEVEHWEQIRRYADVLSLPSGLRATLGRS